MPVSRLTHHAVALVVSLLLVLCPARSSAQARGVVHGGGSCTSDLDCSLGGVCSQSSARQGHAAGPVPTGNAALCVCDPWFTGPHCALLNLQPATPGSGLDLRSQGYHSWGGHCVEANGTYHGYFSFMCHKQTLAAWTTASSIVHAVADQPEGPYTYADMVVQPWAHNAIVTRDPVSGTYLLFHIGNAQVDPSKWAPCYDKNSTDVNVTAPGVAPSSSVGAGDGVYVQTAPTAAGPWTPYNNGSSLSFSLNGWWATGISNPTPFIFPNGTTLLAVSASPCPANWGSLAPNCVGLLRAESWRGPYTPLFTTPIVHPESEDPFIWQDPRGNFHLLTNVNTYHHRCAQGVPCGGHAWSTDALTWSKQYIGAFGPVLRTRNGSVTTNAYIERPQIYQDPATRTPLVFFTGLGATSYVDSLSWTQLFCNASLDPTSDCGPTLPDAPVVVQVQHAPSGACLVTNASFPCPGGWANSCPLTLGACTAPTARWLVPASWNDTHQPGTPFTLSSAAVPNACANIDCNSCAAHTLAKAIDCSSSTQFIFDVAPSAPGEDAASAASASGSLRVTACGSSSDGSVCLNGGQGPSVPPCKPGEFYLPNGQVQLASCNASEAQHVWRIVPVA